MLVSSHHASSCWPTILVVMIEGWLSWSMDFTITHWPTASGSGSADVGGGTARWLACMAATRRSTSAFAAASMDGCALDPSEATTAESSTARVRAARTWLDRLVMLRH